MQIGELVKNISDASLKRSTDIDWKGIKGFRDVVAHQYDSLTWEVVWKLMTENIPVLRSSCEMLLAELSQEIM